MDDITLKGYKKNSPYINFDKLMINSNSITMKDVDFPIYAKTNLGESKIMYPNKDYNFKSNKVMETPVHKILNNHYKKYSFSEKEKNIFENEFNSLDENLKNKLLNHISDSGDVKYMPAYSGDYNFKGRKVLEIPVAQSGLVTASTLRKELDALRNQKKKFKTQKEKLILEKTLEEKNKVLSQIEVLYSKISNTEFDSDIKPLTEKAEQLLKRYDQIVPENYKRVDNGSAGITAGSVGGTDVWEGAPKKSKLHLVDQGNGYFSDKNNGTVYRLKDGKYVPTGTNANTPAVSKSLKELRTKGNTDIPLKNTPKAGNTNTYVKSNIPPKPPVPPIPEAKLKFDLTPNKVSEEEFTQLEQSRPDYTPTVEQEEKLNWDAIMKPSSNKIQYSVDNTKVTGNPVYTYRTSNPLNSIINNYKVGKAFQANALPYMNEVSLSNPVASYLNPEDGYQRISNSYDDILKNIPDSTAGVSIASNLYAKQLQAISDLDSKYNSANNATDVNLINSRAKMRTSLNDYNNKAKESYYDEYLQGQGVRDTNINNIVSDSDTLDRENEQIQDAKKELFAFNEGFSDKSTFLDRILGINKIEFDKIAAANRLKEAAKRKALEEAEKQNA